MSEKSKALNDLGQTQALGPWGLEGKNTQSLGVHPENQRREGPMSFVGDEMSESGQEKKCAP